MQAFLKDKQWLVGTEFVDERDGVGGHRDGVASWNGIWSIC